jgi:membrane protease YdiL (CAAX protease family)
MRRTGLIAPETTSANASLTVMSLGQLVSIISIALASFWLIAWFRSRSQYSGWSTRRLAYDVLLGLSVFVLTAPMLWILMKVSTDITKVNYNHPLMQAIQQEPTNILAAVWVAVIAAPIFEEFGFRVLLQGYLQSLADKSSLPKLKIALIGRGRLESAHLSENIDQNESTVQVNHGNLPGSNSYVVEQDESFRTDVSMQESAIQDSGSTSKAWPVLVSGLLFGLAHFEYGVSWIPLVFFGFVLGWLYQKTNRIWPSLVAHMFCNFIGVAGITVQALYGAPPT